jgi:CDGSH-type Zn-finger protein
MELTKNNNKPFCGDDMHKKINFKDEKINGRKISYPKIIMCSL